MTVEITSRSINLLVGLKDADHALAPTVVLQQRSITNQNGEPQSYPGGKQLTAAMKVPDFTPLTLPVLGEFPSVSDNDIKLLVAATNKECGPAMAEIVKEIAAANAEAAVSAQPGTLLLVHDEVTKSGRWVRTFGVRLDREQSGSEFQKLLQKPKEVEEFILCRDPAQLREFKPEDKTPVQRGGAGVQREDMAMFGDDVAAVRDGFRLMFER